jgi:hypothetical protein
MPSRRGRRLGAALRADFASFATHVFAELYPKTPLQMNWHLWVVAAGSRSTRRRGI